MGENPLGKGAGTLSSSYDVVVIGAGIGGLSCASVLAKEGMRVLVVEQQSRPGGYCSSFHRKGFTFDVAINSLSGCSPTGWIGDLLAEMDLASEIEFLPLDPIKELIFPDSRFSLPAQYENYLHSLKWAFPAEAKGIEETFRALEGLFLELKRMPYLFDSASRKEFTTLYPYFTQYRSMTLGQLLDRTLEDERLKGLVSGQCMYAGVSPARASVLSVGSMLLCYLRDGSYQVKGGVQRLADVLSLGLHRKGGRLLFSRRVREILLRERRAVGVRLEDGQEIRAGAVVSAMDARQTFLRLVGCNGVHSELRRQIEGMRPSHSYFMVFLGVDLPLHRMGLCHHIDYFSTYDVESIFAHQTAGSLNEDSLSIGMVIPTLIDPHLAPAGCHVVTLSLLVPYDWPRDWRTAREEVAGRMVSEAEKTIPGLSRGSRVREISTPLTLERFTGNFRGAAYGWEQSPDQAGPRRLSPWSPVDNLYLAGHWTYPGGGVASATVSGRIAAKYVLRCGS